MEGPSIRDFPRIALDKPVELVANKKSVQVKKTPGNLSVGGVFVKGPHWPVGTPVHIKINAAHSFEADGVIRYCDPNKGGGVGIEFTLVPESNRQHLDELIAELTQEGSPVC